MKITYLSNVLEDKFAPGQIVPLEEMPDGVLFHFVDSKGSIDRRYINFYDEYGLWDHKDSPCLKQATTKHIKIGSIYCWRHSYDISKGYII